MIYNLSVTGEQLQVIWGSLLEQPAKLSYPVLEALKPQIVAAEAADAAQRPAQSAMPAAPATMVADHPTGTA